MFFRYLTERMGVSEAAATWVSESEKELARIFAAADETAAYNQLKVLDAMRQSRLSDAHFGFGSGYGYNDAGRDALEETFARIFKAEAALVRPQLISGTHALTAALFGNLRPGDELVSPAGKPYDTLEAVIGIRPARGSLSEYGIQYKQAELSATDGGIDYENVARAVSPKTKMVTIQRSKGYAFRRSLTVNDIRGLIAFIKNISPEIICLVDNCYGEFVDTAEPIEAGADLVAGSLIKNPGGGLAPAGGYVAGKRELVEAAAERLTSPGLGSEVGPTLGLTRTLLQGLFLAPQTVSGCVKGAALAARVFERLGYETLPNSMDAERADIVQAIKLNAPERVLAFCKGIQRAAPVDSFVTPEAAPMPGYDANVVMAAGAFVQGSSIELSADAPMKPPYIVYMQGGLTWAHARAGVAFAADAVMGMPR
ncbi:MAG: methionine gamma-lyase family protein [Clostridiales bacterium]|jgi:cystathionine beta-lyase family protein involved in aluminum resistance|nr:methionine gamma-lyase family protein [Clostridiales bacterium]